MVTPLESIALAWIERHPEYHALLERPGQPLDQAYPAGGDGTTNPFLHLSLHLALAEQLTIDRPPGIRQAVSLLQRGLADEHAAAHAAIDCLAELLWQAQSALAAAPAGQAEETIMADLTARYLDCVQRKASI